MLTSSIVMLLRYRFQTSCPITRYVFSEKVFFDCGFRSVIWALPFGRSVVSQSVVRSSLNSVISHSRRGDVTSSMSMLARHVLTLCVSCGVQVLYESGSKFFFGKLFLSTTTECLLHIPLIQDFSCFEGYASNECACIAEYPPPPSSSMRSLSV
jgi:hypothetical protein